MSISMIGIDHSMAPVDIRALFAFTRKNAGEAMEKLKEQRGIDGCIILSTCNRLEVWASVDDEAELSLYKELCKLKNIRRCPLSVQLMEANKIDSDLHQALRKNLAIRMFRKICAAIYIYAPKTSRRSVLKGKVIISCLKESMFSCRPFTLV